MRDSFDAFEYLDYLRKNWRVPAVAIVSAVVLAILFSLLLPKRYTATASILIDPPGANDVRTATAVSPVYLESLKSFEHFAASDNLFAEAVKRFRLQDANGRPSIESLKRRVLRVSKPRDTKVLEISATLTDPKVAHEFVSFLAERTVALNRSENLAGDRELLDDARRQLAEAQSHLIDARKAAAENATLEKPDTLASMLAANVELAAHLRKELVDAETDAAEYEESAKAANPADADNAAYARRQLPGAKARVAVLRRRLDEINSTLAQQRSLLSKRTARTAEVDAELKTAQTAFDAMSGRIRELQATAGSRGERLRIIDPGIVPQRPSSPDIILNVVVAFLLSAVFSLLYVTLQFVYARRAVPKLRASVRGGLSA